MRQQGFIYSHTEHTHGFSFLYLHFASPASPFTVGRNQSTWSKLTQTWGEYTVQYLHKKP